MKAEDKKLITQLIGSGDTAKAIETLTELLEQSRAGKNHRSTLVNISARFHKLMEEKGRGILFKADEEVLQNRINDDLLNLLDSIEKPAPAKAPAKPAKPEISKKKKEPAAESALPVKSSGGSPKWMWVVGIAAAAIVSYFMLTDKPVEVKFPKICMINDLDSQCCPEAFDRIRVQEAGRQLVVSVLLNKDLPDPYITGIVYDQNRNVVPMRLLVLTMNSDAICYSGLLQRTDGAWTSGRYTIDFTVNQQPAGSSEFTIIP